MTMNGEQANLFESRKRKRPDDPIWDLVIELWYPSGVPAKPANFRRAMNALVLGYKGKGATPDEIRKRRQRYKEKWPSMACTAYAVYKHWDELADEPKTTIPGQPSAKEQAEREAEFARWRREGR